MIASKMEVDWFYTPFPGGFGSYVGNILISCTDSSNTVHEIETIISGSAQEENFGNGVKTVSDAK